MSNRKEILFKGKEILFTDMTKFSLPVDVSALTHRPAVGRNTNTLKKKYCTRRRFKEQNFLQSGNSKEAYLIVSMHFYNSSYHFCKAFEIFHNSFIVISERKVLHDIALILFTFS